MNEKFIAVIGAGVIGSDVALDLSIHNYSVLLKDLSEEILERAVGKIKQSYRFLKLMKKNESIDSLDEIGRKIEAISSEEILDIANEILEEKTLSSLTFT